MERVENCSPTSSAEVAHQTALLLNNSPAITEENSIYSTNMGPPTPCFVEQIKNPAKTPENPWEGVAMMLAARHGGMAFDQVLAVAITRESSTACSGRGRPAAFHAELQKRFTMLLTML